jgi:hypothetical protein
MDKISARFARIAGIVFASAAFLWALAFTAVDARTPSVGEPDAVAMVGEADLRAATKRSVAEAFPGAPDGVDPMVTGPVSAQFRKRQKALACEKAVWPAIPLACYPD